MNEASDKESSKPGAAAAGQGTLRIFLIGFMGCGKTHWARLLSQKLSIPFFDLDEKVEEQEGASITEIFAEKGEEYFRHVEKEILFMLTESHSKFVMATGGGTPCFFNNIDYLKRNGPVVWINCSIDCLHQRLHKEKEKRPLISQMPDEKLKAYIVKKYSSRKIFYEQANIIINEDDVNMKNLLKRIFNE